MKQIKASDAVYNDILSRRIGSESISKTLQRELKPVKKSAIREELEALRKEPRYTAEEVKKELGL